MLKQNLTLTELQAALRIARLTPASTSPLAEVHPAAEVDAQVLQALRAKRLFNGSALTPEWQRTLATLADPQQQATAFVEGAGAGRYFGGAGGVATVLSLADGQQRVMGDMTRESVMAELNGLLGWRSIPDGPPLRLEISIDELAAVAAIVDAIREEQLRAVIDRRQPVAGRVAASDLERQVLAGAQKPDRHWLVSVLVAFAPVGCEPSVPALKSGSESLIRRGWIVARDGVMQLGAQLETLCAAFSSVAPFLALALGAPWREPEVSIFTHGLQAFWGIEFRGDDGNVRRASIARLGARAMDEVLSRHLACLWSSIQQPVPQTTTRQTAPPPVISTTPVARPERPAPVPAAARPAEYAPRPAAAAPPVGTPAAGVSGNSIGRCASCGAPLQAGIRFCVGCGKAVTAGAPATAPTASPAPPVAVQPPRQAVCPNPKCGKPIAAGVKFCTSCGARLAQTPRA